LIRPLQYYSHTVFEFRRKDSRQKLLVGGRYDGLLKKMGSEKITGGCGLAAGMGRVTQFMKELDIKVPRKDELQIFVAATGPIAKKHALPIVRNVVQFGSNLVTASLGTRVRLIFIRGISHGEKKESKPQASE
jgi:histidyl-tRNA synthetase